MQGEIFALSLYRRKVGMTQKQLAAKLGISVGSIGNWEVGIRKPDIITLKKIASILDCTTDELLSTISI